MPGEGVLCSPAHPSSLGEGFFGEPGVRAAHGHPPTQPRGGVAVSAAARVAGMRGLPWEGVVCMCASACARGLVSVCVCVREPGTGRAALRFGGEGGRTPLSLPDPPQLCAGDPAACVLPPRGTGGCPVSLRGSVGSLAVAEVLPAACILPTCGLDCRRWLSQGGHTPCIPPLLLSLGSGREVGAFGPALA